MRDMAVGSAAASTWTSTARSTVNAAEAGSRCSNLLLVACVADAGAEREHPPSGRSLDVHSPLSGAISGVPGRHLRSDGSASRHGEHERRLASAAKFVRALVTGSERMGRQRCERGSRLDGARVFR
jgi:hypothetical protein